MSINITDELHAATTKGKIASAKEVFLTGDTENLQQIGEKTHQLEDSIKNIAATGGASTAAAVTFDNAASGMTAVNAQAAIDEVSSISHFAKRGSAINISTNYNSLNTAEILTLSQAINKVSPKDRVLGFQGTYLASNGWHTIIYTGDSLSTWANSTKWIDFTDNIFNSISKNATFAGIATPTTNPGTPDGTVFYLAYENGTYSNFKGLQLNNEVAIFIYKDSGWRKLTTGIVQNEVFKKLSDGYNKLKTIFVQDINSNTINSVLNIPLLENGFYDKTTGEFVSNDAFRCTKIQCTEGEIYHFNGTIAYSKISAILLYDKDGIVYPVSDSSTPEIKNIDRTIRIPEFITHVAFNAIGSATDGIVLKSVYKTEVIAKEDLKKVYGIIDNSYEYSAIDVTSGFIENKGNINSMLYPGEFYHAIIDVEQGDIYRITTKIKGSKLSSVLFFDENNKIVYADMIGVSSSTITDVDKYIIVSSDIKKIGFNVIKPGGVIKKYTTLKPKAENTDFSMLFNIDDLDMQKITLTNGKYYDYRSIEKGEQTNAAFSGLKMDAKPGDMFSFRGNVAYSAIAAIAFVDKNNNTISYLGGDNTSTVKFVDTGLVKCPEDCVYIVFGAYTQGSENYNIYKYAYPELINANNVKKYTEAPITYCNPYHFEFENSIGDAFENNGFSSNASSTVNSYIIHKQLFKSYRRKFEWKIKVGENTKLLIGTTSELESIQVDSRQTKVNVDLYTKKLSLYESDSTAKVFQSKNIPFDIGPNDNIKIRCSQFDYMLTVSLIKESTLEEVFVQEIATPEITKCGKLIGCPFIQLLNGHLTVLEYNVFLHYNPLMVIVGDSITECGFRQNSYSAKIIERKLDNRGCIVAQGGATIDSLSFSLNSEIQYMKPKYLSLLAGTNGVISLSSINMWKTFCDKNNIKFILNRIPVSLDEINYPWKDKNEIIRSVGILGANFDMAVANSNNPNLGGNADLFGDKVHPNNDGQEAMYLRFISDIPIIE